MYEAHSMGWADAADSSGVNAHACPGKDLSIAMTVEILRGFVRASYGNARVAVPEDGALDIASWTASVDPKSLHMSDGVGLHGDVTLHNVAKVASALMDGDQSGEGLLAELKPRQLQAVLSGVDTDQDGIPDALAQMDLATRAFFYVSTRPDSLDPVTMAAVQPPLRAPLHGTDGSLMSDENSVELSPLGVRAFGCLLCLADVE
jgi:hypothetical protein